MSRLRERVASLLWNSPSEALFIWGFNLRRRSWGWSISLARGPRAGQYYVVDASGQRLVVTQRNRINLLRNGLDSRFDVLESDYHLASVKMQPGDILVDVGANIGEVSLLLSRRRGAVPIAVEAEDVECAAARVNLAGANGVVICAALWEVATEVVWHSNNRDGDSGVFPTPGSVASGWRRTRTLDDVLNTEIPGRVIQLLKLEAEGAEPEVLRGAQESLRRTAFVSVDAGPERLGESTEKEVAEILGRAGFRLIKSGGVRGVLLFERNEPPAVDGASLRPER